MSWTMEKLTKATAALLAALLRVSPERVESIGAIYMQGLTRGYSRQVLQWIVKQSAHETGYWTNKGTRDDRNVFGMSRVTTRQTTQIGFRRINETETSGVYTSIWSSVRDRFLWDSYHGINGRGSAEAYGNVVSAVYHTSPSYAGSVGAVSVDHESRILAAWAVVIPLELFVLISLFKKLF